MRNDGEQDRSEKLPAQVYARLRERGRFLVTVKTQSDKVDISQHVAAQNAVGWKLKNGNYVPSGTGPAALILKNVGFSIKEADFTD